MRTRAAMWAGERAGEGEGGRAGGLAIRCGRAGGVGGPAGENTGDWGWVSKWRTGPAPPLGGVINRVPSPLALVAPAPLPPSVATENMTINLALTRIYLSVLVITISDAAVTLPLAHVGGV